MVSIMFCLSNQHPPKQATVILHNPCIYHSYACFRLKLQQAIHLHYFTHAIPTAPAATLVPKPNRFCYRKYFIWVQPMLINVRACDHKWRYVCHSIWNIHVCNTACLFYSDVIKKQALLQTAQKSCYFIPFHLLHLAFHFATSWLSPNFRFIPRTFSALHSIT